MSIKIGINGFGRIGRCVYRIASQRRDAGIEIVAINDLAPPESLAHLLKYDTVMGRFPGDVSFRDGKLMADGQQTTVYAEAKPENLPWGKHKVDVVIESTGIFRSRSAVSKHIDAGARKVVLTVPPKDPLDAMVVLGVNDHILNADHRLVSNASCTTNCLAPVVKVIHEAVGIEHGLMTTVHAYTNDQRVLDVFHSDLRRARAAAENIIPTSTGAAKAVGKVYPALEGKLNGMAMRVPVALGSIVDLVCRTSRGTSVEEVNAAVKKASQGPMSRYLEYSEEPLVSSDVIRNDHSAVFDALSTQIIDEQLLKVVAWYDNEWGYSNRVVDLVEIMAKL